LDSTAPEKLASWLRDLPARVILEEYKAQNKGTMGMLDAVATIDDGVVIPEIGLGKALATERHPVPLMTGTNRDELKIALFFRDDLVHSVWYLARWPKSRGLYDGLSKYTAAAWRVFAVDDVARQSVTLGLPAYAYRFDWADEGRVLLMDLSSMIGASHNTEVPFVSGDFQSRTSDPMHLFYNSGNQAARLALSAEMMSYWAEFAYTGAPGRGRDGKLPLWRTWTPGGRTPNLMVLDTAMNGGPHQVASELTTKSLYEDVEHDGSLDSAEKRCAVFQVMKSFFGGSNADIKPFLARNCTGAKPS
jgi:para-nitrobenzyl esterase